MSVAAGFASASLVVVGDALSFLDSDLGYNNEHPPVHKGRWNAHCLI